MGLEWSRDSLLWTLPSLGIGKAILQAASPRLLPCWAIATPGPLQVPWDESLRPSFLWHFLWSSGAQGGSSGNSPQVTGHSLVCPVLERGLHPRDREGLPTFTYPLIYMEGVIPPTEKGVSDAGQPNSNNKMTIVHYRHSISLTSR